MVEKILVKTFEEASPNLEKARLFQNPVQTKC
jgi:hypothetical protein